MILLLVSQIFVIFSSVNCQCSDTSWLTSFDTRGQSKCNEKNYFIRGLERGDNNWNDDPISQLDKVECCSGTQQWSNLDVHVVYQDWESALTNQNSWAHCPQGYFLQGLYRSNSSFPKFMDVLNFFFKMKPENNVSNIEAARCAKPVTHPFYYGSCYILDMQYSFDATGRVSCQEGHYITGLFKSTGNALFYLDKLKCCTMAEKPQIVDNAENLKERVMQTTLSKMASLADMLGYSYCYGNRGLAIGEDFEKNENTWEASTKKFWPEIICEGIKCEQRLNLTFGDWSLGVKDIIYGESVIDDLQPETVDTGTRYNKDRTKTTETFEISKTVQETVTHSATNSWTSSHELGISLDFNLPFGIGSTSVSYTFKYETSSSTTNEQSTQNSRTFTITTSKTINANSSAKYNVIVYKTRTTIPYTAVIIARFSTEFRGFMKYGGNYGSANTNYHYQYSNSADRPTVNYRFGSSSVPFYEALKRESESQYKPWLWNEMIRNNPSAQQIINSLTNETQYKFILHGTLSKVTGTKIDVVWESVNLGGIARRETSDIKHVEVPNSNATIKAVAGPNDPPPKVVYPEVSLTPNQTYEPSGSK